MRYSSLWGAQDQLYITWPYQGMSCANLTLSGLKLRSEKSREHDWPELYGHCSFLQIQIMFGNHLHHTQAEGSPGLHNEKEMDYEVASFLTVEKYKTEDQGLGNFEFLLNRDCFPN